MRKGDKLLDRTILCIGTLDSKGPELLYVKQHIELKAGFRALVMDTGSLSEPFFDADITAAEVAEAAGHTLEEVRALEEAGPASAIMTAGAVKVAGDFFREGKFQGVLSIGGGMGSGVASAVMRELPTGVPKFILSSQKIVQAGIKNYVGTKDIVVMPSMADIAGLNRLTKDALNKAVGAIIGMMESTEVEDAEKPLVFMTMTGLSTGCGLEVKTSLENKGFEVAVFHTIGVGGQTFEELVKSYPVQGVIELGLNEIGNELFGGLASAGPDRLEGAGRRGIPQIVTPGCIDIINFLAPETLPEKYKDRSICYHNPQATLPRTTADELKRIAETMASKLNNAAGPVKFLIPMQGFSSLDRRGNIFYDPVADGAFIDSLRNSLKATIELREIDAHINDSEFASAVVRAFLDIL